MDAVASQSAAVYLANSQKPLRSGSKRVRECVKRKIAESQKPQQSQQLQPQLLKLKQRPSFPTLFRQWFEWFRRPGSWRYNYCYRRRTKNETAQQKRIVQDHQIFFEATVSYTWVGFFFFFLSIVPFLNVCSVFVASFVEVSKEVNNKDRGHNTSTQKLLAIQEPQAGSSSAQMFVPQTSVHGVGIASANSVALKGRPEKKIRSFTEYK